MASNNLKQRARALMREVPGLKYTEALRRTDLSVALGYLPAPPYADVRVNPFSNVLVAGGGVVGATEMMRRVGRGVLRDRPHWRVVAVSAKGSGEYAELAEMGAQSLYGDGTGSEQQLREQVAQVRPGTADQPLLLLLDNALELLTSHPGENVSDQAWFVHLRELLADEHTAVMVRAQVCIGDFAVETVLGACDAHVTLGDAPQSAYEGEVVRGREYELARAVDNFSDGPSTLRWFGRVHVRSTGRSQWFRLYPYRDLPWRGHMLLPLAHDGGSYDLHVNATRNVFMMGQEGTGYSLVARRVMDAAIEQGWDVTVVTGHKDPMWGSFVVVDPHGEGWHWEDRGGEVERVFVDQLRAETVDAVAAGSPQKPRLVVFAEVAHAVPSRTRPQLRAAFTDSFTRLCRDENTAVIIVDQAPSRFPSRVVDETQVKIITSSGNDKAEPRTMLVRTVAADGDHEFQTLNLPMLR